MIAVIIILNILYCFCLLYFWYYWQKIPTENTLSGELSTLVSIIIPARNEENSIGNLLGKITNQNYPGKLIDLIVVDDYSSDKTVEIVKRYPKVNLISLDSSIKYSHKKRAIEKGIEEAKHEVIISTDADCLPNRNWLRSLVSYWEKNNPKMLIAPVSYKKSCNLLSIFQSIDLMMLQGITGAGHASKTISMCNGANLMYSKKAFNEVNGFTDIDHISSGDDMLLLQKFDQEFSHSIFFLKSKDAIVYTEPEKTLQSFIQQRIRWASKSKYYKDKKMIALLILVYVYNLSFVVCLFLSIWDIRYFGIFVGGIVFKTIVEMPLFYSVSKFFSCQSYRKYFLLFQPIHILYTIIAASFSQMGKYEWKGRKVS